MPADHSFPSAASLESIILPTLALVPHYTPSQVLSPFLKTLTFTGFPYTVIFPADVQYLSFDP